MIYIRWYLVNPNVQRVHFRICMAKGGRGFLMPSYGGPKLTIVSKKRNKIAVYKKLSL